MRYQCLLANGNKKAIMLTMLLNRLRINNNKNSKRRGNKNYNGDGEPPEIFSWESYWSF